MGPPVGSLRRNEGRSGQTGQAVSGWGGVRKLDVVGEADRGEGADQPEAGVMLAVFQFHSGEVGERMVVTMKSLARRDQAETGMCGLIWTCGGWVRVYRQCICHQASRQKLAACEGWGGQMPCR